MWPSDRMIREGFFHEVTSEMSYKSRPSSCGWNVTSKGVSAMRNGQRGGQRLNNVRNWKHYWGV